MTVTEFADFQAALIYVAGPGLAWLLAFTIASAILIALVLVAAGAVRRVSRWQ